MEKKISLLLVSVFALTPLFAQGGPPETPIDGGLGVLLAAGAIYGVKKLKDLKNKK